MKKILLVYNPVSGSAVFRKKLDAIIESLQRRKMLPVLYRTRAENSVEEFFECVKISDLEKYFDSIAENRTRPIDLGLVNGEEFFINVASAGVFTSIAHEVDSRQKNALGKIAYYLHGLGELPKFKTVELEVKADGKIYCLEAFLFLVLNSPSVAGMKKITDAAKIDDGRLDFLALKKSSPRKLLNLTQKLLAGKCVNSDQNVFYLQAKTFEINSSSDLISDLDGEIGDHLPIKVETVRNALNFFVN